MTWTIYIYMNSLIQVPEDISMHINMGIGRVVVTIGLTIVRINL